jgi:hypothetical protein
MGYRKMKLTFRRGLMSGTFCRAISIMSLRLASLQFATGMEKNQCLLIGTVLAIFLKIFIRKLQQR